MSAAPETRFFRSSSGDSIAYAVHGSGPLVICPAWWVSHVEQDWNQEAFRSFFSQLGEGLTVVRYDRPGVGLSDRAARSRAMEDEAALLADLIAELGADRYSFFAISCGSPVAIVHAAENPDRVERLCFYGAYANGPAICSPDVQNAVISTVKAHWGLGSRALADIFLPDADRETIKAFARQQRVSADVDVAAELLKLTYSMDAQSKLNHITTDALIIHRRDDRAIPYESSREMAAGIKHARLVTLDGRAHPPWIDGHQIAGLANAFLRGAEASEQYVSDVPREECRLDMDNRSLIIAGEQVGLTPLEFAVMAEFIDAPDQVVTRDHLLEKVWKQPFEGSNRIDALIRNLRRKLGDYAPSIKTVIGHGYRFAGWQKQP